MNLLLESFFESYGLIIILVVFFAIIMGYYFLRNRKFQQNEAQFVDALKEGSKVKTYSGFYGEVVKITNTTEGKVATLKLGEGVLIDVDIRALMSLDSREELPEEPVEAEKVEEVKEEPKEEMPEEKQEETEEVKEEKPKKKRTAKKQ